VLGALEQRAAELGGNPNSLAERLVREGLRTDAHPLVGFREDPLGRRQAALVGTRLYVWQIVQTIRDSDNSPGDAAEYLGLGRVQIQAVTDYYADHRDEVDADAEEARVFEERERERWERSQRAFA
jgi:uncharacterized protein (DUF433 family)